MGVGVFTVQMASKELGVHPTHVTHLLRKGALAGRKWGNGWMIYAESVQKYLKDGRKPNMGRPRRDANK